MILEGANKLKEENEYVVQAINSATAGQYCVVTPKNNNETLNMLIDLHQKKLFDEVTSGTKNMDNLLEVLTNEYQKIKEKNPNSLLVVPMLDENEFATTVNNLDKQKMFDETKKIGAITSELYKKLTDAGVEKQKINQKIMIIEKKEEDGKYISWLKEQMPNFVEGISLESKQELSTPETPVASTDIFGIPTEGAKPEPTPVVESTPEENKAPATTGNIFDSVTPPTVEPVATPTPSPEVELPKIDVPTENVAAPKEDVDIFGIPNNQAAAPAPSSPQQPAPEASKEEQKSEEANQFFEAPKAVENVTLEGTTTFSPIPNTEEKPENSVQTVVSGEPPKKNGGFVNLAILLVILIAVTIVSIELGKFLYSVYGA